MTYKIALLAGDGVGPEIITEGVKILNAISEKYKNEINFEQMIRIVEGLQSAVEKIPINEAFDELDNEREYYQEKRKESNERLIKRKGMIGKAIGFTPLIGLFVGYLIVPLVVIGLLSMTTSFSTMSTMM